MYLELLSEIQGFGFKTTLFGIPFFFSFWTAALAAGLSVLARDYIAKQMREFPRSNINIASIGAGLTVVMSIMLHEGSHSIVGWLCGLTTVNGGMSWWGAYVAFDRAINTLDPLYEIAIGLSGVLANFVIMAIATIIVWVMKESRLENAVQFVAVFNYRLALMNLLPIVGLDGSKVAEGLLRPLLSAEVIGIVLTTTSLLFLPYFLGVFQKKSPSKFELLLERI